MLRTLPVFGADRGFSPSVLGLAGVALATDWREFTLSVRGAGQGIAVVPILDNEWCDRLRQVPLETAAARVLLVTSGERSNLLLLRRFIVDDVATVDAVDIARQVELWTGSSAASFVLAPLLSRELPRALRNALEILRDGRAPHSLARLAYLTGCAQTTLRRELASATGGAVRWRDLLAGMGVLRLCTLDANLALADAARSVGTDIRTLRGHIRSLAGVEVTGTTRVGTLDSTRLACELRSRLEQSGLSEGVREHGISQGEDGLSADTRDRVVDAPSPPVRRVRPWSRSSADADEP